MHLHLNLQTTFSYSRRLQTNIGYLQTIIQAKIDRYLVNTHQFPDKPEVWGGESEALLEHYKDAQNRLVFAYSEIQYQIRDNEKVNQVFMLFMIFEQWMQFPSLQYLKANISCLPCLWYHSLHLLCLLQTHPSLCFFIQRQCSRIDTDILDSTSSQQLAQINPGGRGHGFMMASLFRSANPQYLKLYALLMMIRIAILWRGFFWKLVGTISQENFILPFKHT